MTRLRQQLLFLIIRFAGLGLRLLFFALFFRYSEALYGRYGIVAVSITLGTYLLGFEFYNYAQREWLKTHGQGLQPFKHQFLFYLLVYPVVLPLFYLLFYFGFLDRSYLLWFYAVLIAEHLSLEVYRILFVLQKPLWANINLFLRSGFWMIFPLWDIWTGRPLTIDRLLRYWFAGDLLALATVWIIWRQHRAHDKSFNGFDKQWILKGLRTGLPFFLAVIHFKAVEFSDRYVIDWFADDVRLGVYTFFANMSQLVNTVVYTTVVSVMYPRVVESLMNRQPGARQTWTHFTAQVRKWTLITAAGALVAMPLLLYLLGKQVHLQYYDVFAVLVVANVLYNFSVPYHFALYSARKDWLLARAVIIAAAVNLGLNLLLVPRLGIRAAAWTTLLAMWIIYLVKKRAARPLLPAA